jgi:dihydrofolate reductase
VIVSLIAAVAENGVIGADNDLPWHIPSDFAFFKRMTLGKPLIMGRKTFESIGRPLPGRTNIVVTRQHGYQPDGVIVIDDLDAALAHARSIAEADGVDEIMIGGGGQIFQAALPLADRLYVTHVDAEPDGSTHFPRIEAAEWKVVSRPENEPSDKDSNTYQVRIYERARPR